MSAIKYPELQDAAWLRAQYRDKTMYEIAWLVGCSDSSVYLALRRHGIGARSKAEQRKVAKFKPRICRGCQETFQPTSTCQPYCSECRPSRPSGPPRVRHKCAYCQEFFRPRGRRWTYYSREFCSAEHRLMFLDANQGKATRHRRNGDGYVEVRVGVGYPGARSNGYMLEHRYVMEQQLGRALYPHEEVHHKYGQRDDNRPEQLELWSTSQPAGQRVEDKLAWAQWFLEQYGYAVVLTFS